MANGGRGTWVHVNLFHTGNHAGMILTPVALRMSEYVVLLAGTQVKQLPMRAPRSF